MRSCGSKEGKKCRVSRKAWSIGPPSLGVCVAFVPVCSSNSLAVFPPVEKHIWRWSTANLYWFDTLPVRVTTEARCSNRQRKHDISSDEKPTSAGQSSPHVLRGRESSRPVVPVPVVVLVFHTGCGGTLTHANENQVEPIETSTPAEESNRSHILVAG